MICFRDIGDFITLVETVVMFRITESDHSDPGQKGPLGLPNTKSCSKQVQLKQIVHGRSVWVLNISTDGDLQHLFQYLTILRVQIFSLIPTWSFPCSSLCLWSLVVPLSTYEKSLTPTSLHPPLSGW